jgi:hypothetical protein
MTTSAPLSGTAPAGRASAKTQKLAAKEGHLDVDISFWERFSGASVVGGSEARSYVDGMTAHHGLIGYLVTLMLQVMFYLIICFGPLMVPAAPMLAFFYHHDPEIRGNPALLLIAAVFVAVVCPFFAICNPTRIRFTAKKSDTGDRTLTTQKYFLGIPALPRRYDLNEVKRIIRRRVDIYEEYDQKTLSARAFGLVLEREEGDDWLLGGATFFRDGGVSKPTREEKDQRLIDDIAGIARTAKAEQSGRSLTVDRSTTQALDPLDRSNLKSRGPSPYSGAHFTEANLKDLADLLHRVTGLPLVKKKEKSQVEQPGFPILPLLVVVGGLLLLLTVIGLLIQRR